MSHRLTKSIMQMLEARMLAKCEHERMAGGAQVCSNGRALLLGAVVCQTQNNTKLSHTLSQAID